MARYTRGRWLGDGPAGADWHGEFRKRLVNIENYTTKTCPTFASFVNTWKRLSRQGGGRPRSSNTKRHVKRRGRYSSLGALHGGGEAVRVVAVHGCCRDVASHEVPAGPAAGAAVWLLAQPGSRGSVHCCQNMYPFLDLRELKVLICYYQIYVLLYPHLHYHTLTFSHRFE